MRELQPNQDMFPDNLDDLYYKIMGDVPLRYINLPPCTHVYCHETESGHPRNCKRRPWRAREYQLLEKYGAHYTAGFIAKHILPHRTESAINSARSKIGIRCSVELKQKIYIKYLHTVIDRLSQ